MRKPKILIAEDNIDVVESVIENLSKYDIITANNPDEAIHQINTHPDIQCLICDYNFERYIQTGHYIYLNYRAFFPKQPFILFSSEILKVRDNFTNPHDHFLEKPIGFHQLASLVDHAIKLGKN